MDLIAVFDTVANRNPEAVAYRAERAELTYGALQARSRSFAEYVSETLPKGAPVVLRGHREPAMLVGIVGAMRAAHPYVPLDIEIPEARVTRILNLLAASLPGAPHVLTPDGIDRIWEQSGHSCEPLEISPVPKPEDIVYVIFTSGSSGEPKGVVITRRCLRTFVQGMLALFGREEVTVLSQSPFSFDMAVMDMWLALLGGGTMVALSRRQMTDPSALFDALHDSGATLWQSTPSFLRMCLPEPRFDAAMMPALRRFILAGETLPPALVRQLFERFPRAEVWNGYGPTEATVGCTYCRVERGMLTRYPSVPIGRALPGIEIELLDACGNSVDAGQRGEIVVSGPSVSPGYIGHEDPAFFQRHGEPAFRTGDWGREEDGLLFHDGRMHGLIKLAGNRIEPGDVEANLCALEGVVQAVVSVVHGKSDYLVGFVVLRGPKERSDVELSNEFRARLAMLLPRYMVPKRIVFLDAFPTTPGGKVDRHRLVESLA